MKLDEVSDDERFSIYMQMYKNHRMISHFTDEFYIDYPSTQILEELKLKEGPTLGRKRTTYGINGEVLEISYSQYNTRMHNYVINFDVRKLFLNRTAFEYYLLTSIALSLFNR